MRMDKNVLIAGCSIVVFVGLLLVSPPRGEAYLPGVANLLRMCKKQLATAGRKVYSVTNKAMNDCAAAWHNVDYRGCDGNFMPSISNPEVCDVFSNEAITTCHASLLQIEAAIDEFFNFTQRPGSPCLSPQIQDLIFMDPQDPLGLQAQEIANFNDYLINVCHMNIATGYIDALNSAFVGMSRYEDSALNGDYPEQSFDNPFVPVPGCP